MNQRNGLQDLIGFIEIKVNWVVEHSKDKPFNNSTQEIKDAILMNELTQSKSLLQIAKNILKNTKTQERSS